MWHIGKQPWEERVLSQLCGFEVFSMQMVGCPYCLVSLTSIQRRQKPPLALGFKELLWKLDENREQSINCCVYINYTAENVLWEIKTMTYSEGPSLFLPSHFLCVFLCKNLVFKIKESSQVCCGRFVIPALERWRQEGHNLRLALGTQWNLKSQPGLHETFL